METKKQHIETADGYRLGITAHLPDSEPKGVVQINSGTGIPQYLYANLAGYLAENGFVAVTYDYRGIGESRPESLRGFEAKMADWGKQDMVAVLNWSEENYPEARKIVIGHSMGGQLFGLMENQHLVSQFIMIASSTGYWKDMRGFLRWAFPVILYGYMPLSARINGFVNAKKIRQGENLPKDVALQWRSWCMNPQYFTEYLSQVEGNFYQEISQPIHAYYFTDDPIAHEVTTNKILSYYPNADITKSEISPEDLGVSQIGHMGFFSRKFRETLWQDLLHKIDSSNSQE